MSNEQRQRGRGRGRGRGRENIDQSGFPVHPRGPAPVEHTAPAVPGLQSAWAVRAQQQAAAAATGPPAQRPPAPQAAAGRALHRSEASSQSVVQRMGAMNIGGSGEAASALVPATGSGRGSTRGRFNPDYEIIRTRPAHTTTKSGSTGQSIRLRSNYFKIISMPDWALYHYRVDFAPDEDRIHERKALLRDHKAKFGGYLFDGSALYVSHRLHPDPMELFSNRKSDDTNIRITVKYVADLAQGDHHYLQVYNIIMRKCLDHLKLQLVGRNFFDARAKVDIREHHLELWPGYITSIRQHENEVLMCSEITHKVMRRDTVLDLLHECYSENKNQHQKLFQQRIVGAVVLTDYNNRTYRISDVDFNTTPTSTFQLRDGSKIRYQDYFKNRYQLKIQDLNQPLLVSRAKPREIRAGMAEMVYLIPELCRMTGLTDAQRGNFNLMRALADHTRVAPRDRVDKLLKFCKRLCNEPSAMAELKEWDLKLATQLIELPARVIPPEKIIQHEQRHEHKYISENADWTRELRAKPMLISAEIRTGWVCICPSMFKGKALEFVQLLQKAAKGMNFNLPMPKLHEVRDDRVPTYLEALEVCINSYQPHCILCIASNNKIDRYSAIKKKCCVDKAVPTQVVLSKTLNNKGLMSVATKVAIQINCKLGGAPWGVEIPLSQLMVIGFDVCHDTLNKTKSYGAMVASLNRTCSRYFSAVSAHSSGEELSNDFSTNIVKAVRAYYDLNKSLPTHIIIYRDGVGDGQLSYVHTHEVELIKTRLREFYPKDIKLAFIIVSKRINTRFFMMDNNNPPPGTVVDNVVTLPERYDFFIVSQSVRQGSVSPTSYNVIEDTLGLDPDKIQRLTYKFCHMYYNWSGTVRVPAPCQYAHKLAFLVGQALHKTPNPKLDKCLYFL